jgi:hypothetical protein
VILTMPYSLQREKKKVHFILLRLKIIIIITVSNMGLKEVVKVNKVSINFKNNEWITRHREYLMYINYKCHLLCLI